MILGVYLSIPYVRRLLNTIKPGGCSAGTGERVRERPASLRNLILRWVPALVNLGIKVRDCTWVHTQFGTGFHARECLEVSLGMLTHLTRKGSRDGGYLRGLTLALLQWSEYHTALPGCAHVQESGEALLSRLAGSMKHHSNSVKPPSVHNLFLLLHEGREQQGMDHRRTHARKPRVTQGAVNAMRDRVVRLIYRVARDTLPYVKKVRVASATHGKGKGHRLQVVAQWPVPFVHPVSPFQPFDNVRLRFEVYKQLDTLLFTQTARESRMRRTACEPFYRHFPVQRTLPPQAYVDFKNGFTHFCHHLGLPKPKPISEVWLRQYGFIADSSSSSSSSGSGESDVVSDRSDDDVSSLSSRSTSTY